MAAFNFHRRQTRRWWYVGATLVVAAFFSVFFVVGASATLTLGGGTFDTSNGSLYSNTNNDWNPPNTKQTPTSTLSDNLGPVQPINCGTTIPTPYPTPSGVQNCALDLTGSKVDNALGQGTKEDDVSPTVVDGSIPPQKDDLSRFYINQQLATQDGTSGTGSNAITFHKGDNLLYLAWERTNLLGSAHMDFELNQNPVGITPNTTGTVDINRTPGDVLIDFDFGGSGVPTLQWHKWLTTANAPTGVASADCAASTTFPCWGVAKDIGAAGEASVNGANVYDYNPPNAPTALQGTTTTSNNKTTVSSTFGEAGIDLQAAGIFSSFQCSRFGDAWLKSRSSGNSFTSELKDFIAPLPINISNCGEIKIIKNTDPANANKDFTYSTNVPSGSATNAATFSTTPDSTGSTTGFTLNARNDVTISSVTTTVSPGTTTTITTNKPVLLSGQPLANGDNVTITGTNTTPIMDGTYAVSGVNNTATSTTFSIPFATSAVGSAPLGSLVFNTEDITNVVPNGTNGAPATYTVNETPMPSGWALKTLNCTASTGSTGAQDTTTTTQANITVIAGGVVTCTYVNKPQLGALLINKNSLKSGVAVLKAGAQFCYSTTTPNANNDPVCDSTGTVVTDLGPTGTVGSTGDQSLTTGVICVKGLTPGTYYLNETAAPTGYGLVTTGQKNKSVTVVDGTNCSTTLPSSTATGKVTFTDPPLSDVIIAFRDGGSGETSIVSGTPMTCSADNSTGTDATTGTGFGTPTGWGSSDAISGVQIGSSNVTVTCTAVIDP